MMRDDVAVGGRACLATLLRAVHTLHHQSGWFA
jgi:hypothetical protein